MSVRIIPSDSAAEEWKVILQKCGATEFAVISNPGYIYQPFELFALAPKTTGTLSHLAAVVMDMDGTTTTTEPICLHSLEWMIRCISGRMDSGAWRGLDRERDYPHVIGNSTTRHVEYLIDTYGSWLNRDAYLRSFIQAALWTLTEGKDPQRRREVVQTAQALNVAGFLTNPQVCELIDRGGDDKNIFQRLAADLAPKFIEILDLRSRTNIVRGAIDIYYQRYHEILARIAAGEGRAVAAEIGLQGGEHPVEPMPGVAVYLAAMKGLLGEELGAFAVPLLDHLHSHPGVNRKVLPGREEAAARLARLGARLEHPRTSMPVRTAVVTSSIFHEANIVLSEVVSIMRRQIEQWPISEHRKKTILTVFEHYTTLYDSVITASDSSEIRLKPHRDLYSIALHQLGIPREEYSNCIGFEDSESGTIAIRAAGIGLCVAVPFADTAGHDLSAASIVLTGGLPEALVVHQGFLFHSS